MNTILQRFTRTSDVLEELENDRDVVVVRKAQVQNRWDPRQRRLRALQGQLRQQEFLHLLLRSAGLEQTPRRSDRPAN